MAEYRNVTSADQSLQPLAGDLHLKAAAGSDDITTSKTFAGVMGNIFGDTLTKAGNVLAGVLGQYSILGSGATKLFRAAVAGVIGAKSQDADGAFVAVLDGDPGGATLAKARAAFTVDNLNSVTGATFDYCLDAQGRGAHDGFLKVTYAKAVARYGDDVCLLLKAGAPVDGASGDGAAVAGKGSTLVDSTNGKEYINTGTKASPTWTVKGTQS